MTHRPFSTGITARELINIRREIGCFLDPGLFSDPAYDILLTLLAAEDDRRPVAVSDSVRSANVPATTALRWIKLLETRGLVTRSPDPEGNNQDVLILAASCRAALRSYLEQVSLTLGST